MSGPILEASMGVKRFSPAAQRNTPAILAVIHARKSRLNQRHV
jgi:hypothetical protein